MPILLDPSLPESLYPLAWLVGRWSGSGAVHLRDDSGEPSSQRVEQEVTATARDDGTLRWSARTHVVDAPAPLPPTSAFAKEPAATPPAGSGERRLLQEETGVWTVGDPLPGQDLDAARSAAPGDPAGVISYQLEARLSSGQDEEIWLGEVRGPRIQLARKQESGVAAADGALTATRMFGLVGGRLMWLLERATDPKAPQDLQPYLSLELDRVR